MTSASRGEVLEHPLDLLGRGDGLGVFRRAASVTLVGVGVAKFLLALPPDQFLHSGPPRNHRQVCRQRADPLEPTEYPVIVVHDLEQDFGGDVLDVLRRDDTTPAWAACWMT